MYSSIAILAGMAATAVARSTTVMPIFLGSPAVPGQQWAGAVENVENDQTTYEIQCTSGCGTAGSSVVMSITVGPSNFDYGFETTISGQVASASETCKLSGTTVAVCDVTVSVDLEVEGVTSIDTNIVTRTTFSGSEVAGVPVTITRGAEKLASATGSGSSSGALSTGASSTSGSGASNSASGSVNGATSSANPSGSGATSLNAGGKAGNALALVMFSAVVVSVGALITL